MTVSENKNVLGEPLEICSMSPLTGFTRNGCCETASEDLGMHVICARLTKEFLQFSLSQGNDLVTPVPEFGFPGLKPGDRWCLCAERWAQALKAGYAPSVYLRATHENALKIVALEDLKAHAIDLN